MAARYWRYQKKMDGDQHVGYEWKSMVDEYDATKVSKEPGAMKKATEVTKKMSRRRER